MLECYYCESDYGTPCNGDEIGSIITCQMHSSSELHYGDVCAIGHTGKIMLISLMLAILNQSFCS